MKLPAFHCRICVAAIVFVLLAWVSLAFSGEIHDAAKSGDLDRVKALLREKPDLVASTDQNNNTPLHLAAINGRKDVVELLLAAKAVVDAKDKYGHTALHDAAGHGHKDVAELLLANKADINAKGYDGSTPLCEAIDSGRKDVAELLRQRGGQE